MNVHPAVSGRALGRAAAFLLALAIPLVPLAAAEPPMPRPPTAGLDPRAEADLFAMPQIADELRLAGGLLAAGDLAGARAVLESLAARHPALGPLHADRAALAMLDGEPEAALAALEAAAATGTEDIAAIAADPLFAPLAADPEAAPRLAALAAPRPERQGAERETEDGPGREAEADAEAGSEAPPPAAALGPPLPSPVRNGVARVDGGNTGWNPETERLEAAFAFPDAPSASLVVPSRPRTAAHELLREHWRRGRAAGHHGDLYDNRDRGHSALDPAAFPQLAHTAYSEAARAAQTDYGLNDRVLFDRIAFGNSSTAITAGPHWRSLPRQALTRPDGSGPMRLWQNWANDHLYVYPAHLDYGRDRGDLFPANTPYLLVSRGSSGSDRPFLEAVAMILAALKPATKARLAAENLVVPTVQMVFRRSLQHVRSRESYFSGDAHPAVFEGSAINLARMVSLAQSIEPGSVPAEARLAVIEEELGTEGVDFFGEGLSEQLFDTPSAVARIWRSKAWQRSMILSAEASRDANGRSLTFHWRLLQGDPNRVTIEPLEDGRRARVTLSWHDPFPTSEDNPEITARVDIAVFAHNGVHDSAPAILSWYFPPHETRVWEEAAGGRRIAAIDHADPDKAETYADPLLVPRADWRDTYRYGPDGTPLGWTRHRGGTATDYDADGARILAPASGSRPARTDPVAYPLARRADGTLAVEEVSAGAGHR